MNAEDLETIFTEALEMLQRAAFRLEESLGRCTGLIPADALAFESLGDVDLERLDALGVRYARCQELFGKALYSCAVIRGLPTKPFALLLDGLRGEGLSLPINDWSAGRGLRNLTGHAYLMSAADFVDYYREVAAVGPQLVESVRRLAAFVGGAG